AYNKFYPVIRPGGLLITDSRYVKTAKKVDAQQKEIAMFETIMDKVGKPIVFNICMLGVVISITELVKPESIMNVLERRIPAEFLDMNRTALDIGITLGQAAKTEMPTA
ncbi:MAG: 2-oxoacid:acceptor oxidoreductase family protein, partial [Desulfobacterales bacterium]